MEHSTYSPRQPVTLTIKFRDAEEAKDLHDELTTWTPTNGWGSLAREFFDMLKDCMEDGHE